MGLMDNAGDMKKKLDSTDMDEKAIERMKQMRKKDDSQQDQQPTSE